MTETTEILEADAVAQAELVRSGAISAVELVDASIAAVEKHNGELNAVIHERFDRARSEAASDLPDGPFKGVPYLHKDHDGQVPGTPLHHGCKGLKAAGLAPDGESNLARRFREAGMICVGKTNAPEFGLQPTTEPEAYGPTHNPWAPGHTPGGSSGGSAAAVASRMVAVASAGDGGGSIRWPASACGLVGLKTTRGRISVEPEGEAWGGLVVHGFLSRSVRDTAALLDVAAGRQPGDPYAAPTPGGTYTAAVGTDPGTLRVGVLTTPPGGLTATTPDAAEAVDRTLGLLEELGHDVEDVAPTALTDPDDDITADFTNVYTVYVDADLRAWGRAIGKERLEEHDVETGTWMLAEIGREVLATQYHEAWEALRGFSRKLQTWWEVDGWDVLVTPVCPEPPPPHGQFGAPPDNPMQGLMRSASIVPFLAPFNVTGQPAVSVPMHWNGDGLPIGVQLVGAFGREDLLLRLAGQLEQAAPWADRRPPVGV